MPARVAVPRAARARAVLALLAALLAGCGPAAVARPPAEPVGSRVPAAPPPSPPPSPPGPSLSASPSASPPAARPLGRSVPEHLDIPRIGVSSPVGDVGLKADGTVEVPPFTDHSPAAWYRYSPTPGELGPAVLLGHSTMGTYGPSVFYRLGALRPGDRIDVRRADGRTARFGVERVARYPKAAFPTSAVYGNTDHAALRLITCGGDRAPGQAHYPDNVVVFARLLAVV